MSHRVRQGACAAWAALACALVSATAPSAALAPGPEPAQGGPPAAAPGWAGPAAGAAAAASVPAAPVPAVPELVGGLLAESRVLYPLRVGPWVAEAEHRYPDQRLGVSVRYIDNRKQRWIDLYFYPAGPQTVPMLAAVAASERDAIALAAGEAGRAVRMGELERLELPRTDAPAEAVPAWRLGLAYPEEGMASAMLLFARQMYLVKARASAAEPPATLESLQADLLAFMAVVAGQVRIASTGACWLPARVELADRLPDAGLTLARYRDPGQDEAAVVYGDRVLVAREQAARAPELAQALAAALYPGCVAPELIEPEVPPSLREIRIEYRRPLDAAPDTRTPSIGSPRTPSRGTG